MKTLAASALAVLAFALCLLSGASVAAEPCEVPSYLWFGTTELKHVAEAVKKDKRLTIAVVGTGSSILAGPDGPPSAYPARLEAALKQKLPSVAVKVVTLVRTRMTAADLAQGMAKLLVDEKPNLVIWQTGTLDAIRRIEPDDFRTALDEGVETLHRGGADVILMNMQYSPRTETLIAVSPFADNMRWVAHHRGVPLFDRLAVMRHWSDVGTFDLSAGARDFGLAQRVHDCIGRALAALILDSARLNSVHSKAPQ